MLGLTFVFEKRYVIESDLPWRLRYFKTQLKSIEDGSKGKN
jgi:hypothetical protein